MFPHRNIHKWWWWWVWSSRWNERQGNRRTQRKPVPVPLYPPHIPHYLTWAWSRRLTASVVARPTQAIHTKSNVWIIVSNAFRSEGYGRKWSWGDLR
jgi:hypothetical protein